MIDGSGDIVFSTVHIVIDFRRNVEIVTFYQLLQFLDAATDFSPVFIGLKRKDLCLTKSANGPFNARLSVEDLDSLLYTTTTWISADAGYDEVISTVADRLFQGG